MSDDYNGSDQEYWDDMYYYENYDKEMDPNSWPGHSGPSIKGGFWIWFIALIIVCNLSTGLGEAFIIVSLIWWLISKFAK